MTIAAGQSQTFSALRGEIPVARICTLDGETLGTGFAITCSLLLTCEHVVEGASDVRVIWPDGTDIAATHTVDPHLVAFDMAFLHCANVGRYVLPAVASPAPPRSFRSSGYHYGDAGFTSAVPIQGAVLGETSLRYGNYDVRAWALAGMQFGAGISGAPLIDEETDVVLGLINTKFNSAGGGLTGTGLPLTFAAAGSPALTIALLENTNSAPRFGQFVNAIGAQAILAEHGRLVAQRYVDRSIYLPDRVVARTALDTSVEEFIASADVVLPVIGVAGSGKSTFVAGVAAKCARPAFVIPALNIDGIAQSIERLCANAIDETGLSATQRPTVDGIITALRQAGTQPIIVIDGLNEARISPADVRDPWLPTAAAWCRDRGVKLIVTSRPEYWEPLRESLNPESLRVRAPVALGSFNDAELAAALRQYGLAPNADLDGVFRHPLMLRILVELRDANTKSNGLRRSQALAKFVDRQAAVIAQRIQGSPPASTVRRLLSRLAKELFDAHTLDIDRSTFDTLTQPPPDLGWTLLKENMLFESGALVRFTFDEIAEFLIAEQVGLAALDARTIAYLESPTPPVSPAVAVQILRFANDHDDENLPNIVEGLAVASHINSFQTPLVLREFLTTVSDASPFLPAIQRLVQTSSTDDKNFSIVRHWTIGIVGQAALPVDQAIDLMRSLVASQKGYGWRDKDRTIRVDGAASGDLGAAIENIIERNPAPALSRLATWLGDETPMRGGEGSLGSFASVVLGANAQRWDDALVDSIADTQSARAADLLGEAYRTRTADLAGLWNRWAIDGRASPDFLFRSARHIAASNVELAIPLFKTLLGVAKARELRTGIQETLIHYGAASSELERDLIAAFADGSASLYSIRELLPTHFDSIAPAIRARMLTGGERADVVGFAALAGIAYALPTLPGVVALIRELTEAKSIDANQAAFSLEQLFYGVNVDAAESSGMFDLASELIDRDRAAVRQSLGYIAFPQSASAEREPIAERVRRLLIDAAHDESTIKLLLALSLSTSAHATTKRTMLDTLLPRLTPANRDRSAFSLLLAPSETDLDALSTWMLANESQLGAASAPFIARVKGGEAPHDAARATVDEFLRRGA